MMRLRKIMVLPCFLLILTLIGCSDTRLVYHIDNGARGGNRFGVTNAGGGTRAYGSFGSSLFWKLR